MPVVLTFLPNRNLSMKVSTSVQSYKEFCD